MFSGAHDLNFIPGVGCLVKEFIFLIAFRQELI
jgi:hypothetical protein